jgi:hypothetical protein
VLAQGKQAPRPAIGEDLGGRLTMAGTCFGVGATSEPNSSKVEPTHLHKFDLRPVAGGSGRRTGMCSASARDRRASAFGIGSAHAGPVQLLVDGRPEPGQVVPFRNAVHADGDGGA